jgi:MoaA/NifB/PqqE/SkfB family radical SAM enzyme
MAGLRAAKKIGMSVGISASVTPEDFRAGELDRIVEMAKKEGAHEVVVFDVMPTGRMKEHDELLNNEEWIDQMIASTKKYNDDPSYPAVTLFAYATSYRSTGCSCGVSYFYVSPYGDVNPCDFNHKIIGNIVERPLWQVWDELTQMEGYGHAKWGGCKIKDADLRQRGIAVADQKMQPFTSPHEAHVKEVIERVKEYQKTTQPPTA